MIHLETTYCTPHRNTEEQVDPGTFLFRVGGSTLIDAKKVGDTLHLQFEPGAMSEDGATAFNAIIETRIEETKPLQFGDSCVTDGIPPVLAKDRLTKRIPADTSGPSPGYVDKRDCDPTGGPILDGITGHAYTGEGVGDPHAARAAGMDGNQTGNAK